MMQLKYSGWLTRVDPLIKIIGLAIYLAIALLINDPYPMVVLSAGAMFLLLSSPIGRYPKLLALAFSSIASISLLHWFLGGSPQAIAATGMRLFILMAMSAALMLSTDPAHLLRSLRRLPLPAGLLLGLSVMWRSLPVLKRELIAILHACRLEGIKVGLSRPRRMFRYVLIPLAFGMTRFADDLTLSLTSRGISLRHRHVRPENNLNKLDLYFSLFLTIILSITVWLII